MVSAGEQLNTATLVSQPKGELSLLEKRVDDLLRELLLPENRGRLEQYRYLGSSNRVYRIPLSEDGREFIILKLLPSALVLVRKRVKKFFRNLLYGEHEVVTGRKRVRLEIERVTEWREEGLNVPTPVRTSVPEARVFVGLHYPTFFTVLEDPSLSDEQKLEIFASVTRSLSFQHRLAWERRKKSLVHPDPGPWNIMYDPGTKSVYWFDLEHPAEYPKMGLETLMVRSLRIFLYGVLDQLGHRFDDVLEVFTANYELDFALSGLVLNMQNNKSSLMLHAAQVFGLKKGSTKRRRRISRRLAEILESHRRSVH